LLDSGRYRVRALTRRRDSAPAQALAQRGAEVVVVPLQPGRQAKELANAAVAAGVENVVFSALENVEARTGATKWAPHFTDKGWSFPWASSFGSDFNYDFNVSFTEEQQQSGAVEYNFHTMDTRRDLGDQQTLAVFGTDAATTTREAPGISAFALEDGVVYHTYSAYTRGLDGLWGMYQWLAARHAGATRRWCEALVTSEVPSGTAATTSTTASDACGITKKAIQPPMNHAMNAALAMINVKLRPVGACPKNSPRNVPPPVHSMMAHSPSSKTCPTLSVAVREGAKKRSEVIVDCLSSPDRLAECGLHIRRLLVIERSRSRSVAAVEGDCPLRYDLAGCRHERGSPSP
jgi:hypothetical protein